mgnify:FL=1
MCYNEIGEKVKSIITNNEKEYIINKSKFITKIYKVTTEKQIVDILDNIKKEYKDSTHICYAYIIDNIKRFNDDGEPGGTAGMPILNVLENNELNYVFAVVIRYFGGIKLGAGGLVRAYSNSVSETLKNNIKDLEQNIRIEILFDYSNSKKIDFLLKDISKDKYFGNNVRYEFYIPFQTYNTMKNELNNLCIKVIEKEQLWM